MYAVSIFSIRRDVAPPPNLNFIGSFWPPTPITSPTHRLSVVPLWPPVWIRVDAGLTVITNASVTNLQPSPDSALCILSMWAAAVEETETEMFVCKGVIDKIFTSWSYEAVTPGALFVNCRANAFPILSVSLETAVVVIEYVPVPI